MDNFYNHKTTWQGYTEIKYISKDEKVSFGLYWMDNDVNNVVLHELYVSPQARRQGGGASRALREVIDSLGKSKTLSLWVNDKKLISWYEKRGFVLDGRSAEVIWLTYKGRK